MIDSTLQYLSQVLSCVLSTDSFTGYMNAPCVDGLLTKSKAINSKSGCTSCASLPFSFTVSTEPIPLEDIPNLIPDLNNSFNVNKGLKEARLLLLYLSGLGLPVACEILDPITAQYISDFVTWGAIGARTTESQTHRQMVSGLSFPVGFKNGTSGNVDIAADAMCSARYNHCFMGITDEGKPTICRTRGNPNTHVILRGGKDTPNYTKEYVSNTEKILKDKGETPRIMIDCSHGNSGKDYKNQFNVLRDVISQIKNGSDSIFGVMIESNLNEGKQKLPKDVESLSANEVTNQLKYGVSITDCCVSITETKTMLDFVYENL